jgi:HPt (histidine-containing phosphotransfer) domain-containing protein
VLYPAVPSAAVPACFDWLAFVESLGDEELAAEIVALFIVEAPAMVTRVRDAVRGDSIEEIRQAAHAFKGAVGNLTRVGPMETSARLEAIARGEAEGDAQALMTQLDQQVTGLIVELASVRLPKEPCEF